MEELNKRIIGNAVSAYFLVFVSIFFLINKDPNINHPFVRSHVKVAFILHMSLLLMFFVMSYSFLDTIQILHYSLNTLITAVLAFFVFGSMLYGMYKARLGETLTLGDIFQKAGITKHIIQYQSSDELKEEERTLLILAHVPFLGYIIHPRHKKIPFIEDVAKLNLFTMIIACLFFVFGYKSLASLIFLGYIIWSVFQALRLSFEHHMTHIDLSFFPNIEQKYLLQKALFPFLKNIISHNTYSSLKDIAEQKRKLQYQREIQKLEHLKTLSPAKVPAWIFYTPYINIVGIFFWKTQEQIHIRNGIIITLLYTALLGIFGWDTTLVVFLFFPIFYGIGCLQRKAYPMPYIYDIHRFLGYILLKIGHIFQRTRNLQKTDIQESITMNKSKKES